MNIARTTTDSQLSASTQALTKAIIWACSWLDSSLENRMEAVKILSRPNYVDADEAVVANSMTDTFEYEPGDNRATPDFNLFFKNNASYPWASDCIWYRVQMMRRWQVREQTSDTWYAEMAKSVYRADIYEKTANLLVKTGFFFDKDFPPACDGCREHLLSFLEGRAHVRGVVTQHSRATETLLRRRASLSLQTAT